MPEVSEAQINSEHFKLIRENPEYRNFLMMEEMRAEMQPSLSSYQEPKEEEVKHIYQYYHSDISRKQWDTFEQTIRKVDYLERKLNETSDKKKKEEYSIGGEGS